MKSVQCYHCKLSHDVMPDMSLDFEIEVCLVLH